MRILEPPTWMPRTSPRAFGSRSTGELRGRFRVARAVVEDGLPEAAGFGGVAPFVGQRGEVAQGEVAVNALVDTAKLLGTLESRDPPPGDLRLGRLARHAVKNGLAEEQLCITGVE